MAITTTPYGQFMLNLGQGAHDVLNNPLNVVLVTSGYTPDFTNDYLFSAIAQYEVANDSTTGGYQTGGRALANRALSYDGAGGVATLAADPVSWNVLSAIFRYAIVLDNKNADGGRMLGLLNFGVDRSYVAESFVLSFPGGVMTFSGA
jgi:hypothetical protein